MKILEIIELRSIYPNRKFIKQQINSVLITVTGDDTPISATVYTNIVIDTDFSIHLGYDHQLADRHMSPVGEQLIVVLNEYGMVNHGIWHQKNALNSL